MDDVVTIAQAAEIAGVHKNTIRSWIKTGRVVAAKVMTDRGQTYMIPRTALELPQNGDSDPDATVSLVTPSVSLSPNVEAVVQRVVSPFMAELQSAYLQLGAAQERIRQLERDVEALKALPETTEPVELIASKDQTIAQLKARLAEKDETIEGFTARVAELRSASFWQRLTGRY